MSSTQVVLTWVDVGSEASYRIERSLDGATGWTRSEHLAGPVTTYTNDGLSAATTYSYRVVAINDGGSTVSNVVQVTTQAETPRAPRPTRRAA